MLLEGSIRYEGKVKLVVTMPREDLANLFLERDNGKEIYIVYEVSSWEKLKEVLKASCFALVKGLRYSNTTLL